MVLSDKNFYSTRDHSPNKGMIQFWLWQMRDRSSHQRYSVTKSVLRNFVKFTEKYMCQGLYFNKFAGWLWYRCFPVNFTKFFNINENIVRSLLKFVTTLYKIKTFLNHRLFFLHLVFYTQIFVWTNLSYRII